MNHLSFRPQRLFVACFLLSVAYVLGISLFWDAAVRAYESYFQAAPDGPSPPKVPGRLFLDHDPCYWITYAREMVRTGVWRIRHTFMDNTPQGRPVHWSQSVSWLLLAAGGLRHMMTGEPMDLAIENGSIWVGPAQLVILISALGLLLYRRLGAVPAGVWMLGMAANGNVYWICHALRPDHHGLHLAFVLGSVACLIFGGLGWLKPAGVAALCERPQKAGSKSDNVAAPREREGTAPSAGRHLSQWFAPLELPDGAAARRYFIAAGVLGGLGIWTGATVQLFGIGLIAVGAMLLVLFMPRRLHEADALKVAYLPSLWRLWAITGAVTSLIFYAVEYAPRFPGMRLEVNHPLYALSWFCVGELLTRWSGRKLKLRAAGRWTLPGDVLLLAGAALLPALLIGGPAEWHMLRDPAMRRLHHFITEFYSLKVVAEGRVWLRLWKSHGLLPLLLFGAVWLAHPKRTRLYEWAALWMSFLPAFAYLVLGFLQVRWMAMFSAASLWLMAVMVAVFWRTVSEEPRRAWMGWGLALVMALQAATYAGLRVKEVTHIRDGRSLVGEIVKPMLQRFFITRLSALNEKGDWRFLCEPDLAGPMFYYGGIPCLTSYYWENIEGLKAATAFLSDAGEAEAVRVARERGLTHVVLPHSAEMAHIFHFIREGYFSEQGARAAMAGRLVAAPKRLPSWIHRDEELTKLARTPYSFRGVPVFGTMDVFRIDQDKL